MLKNPGHGVGVEGELSYHARMEEGGSSIFIIPSTGEIILIDQGRIMRNDGFYRNKFGEVFKPHGHKSSWDRYAINEESGGKQCLN